jgi:iron complex outermembrane recepter protein
MKTRHRFAIAACRTILAVALAAPLSAAWAQAGGVPAEETASSDKLETIVVTARRRSENLQEVPVAVTAITAEQLQTSAVRTLEDLTGFAPNIKVNAGRATNSTINAYIRGVGQNDPLWGFEPGVGIYVDDVYLARPQAALLDVYDVDRIEILRGPQGTLYGKNTIAGAIKYVTRDIVGPATGSISLTGGNYGERDVKASLSGPIVEDHVYGGVAIAYLRRDGYGHVVADATPQVSARTCPTRTCWPPAPTSRSRGVGTPGSASRATRCRTTRTRPVASASTTISSRHSRGASTRGPTCPSTTNGS